LRRVNKAQQPGRIFCWDASCSKENSFPCSKNLSDDQRGFQVLPASMGLDIHGQRRVFSFSGVISGAAFYLCLGPKISEKRQ